MANIPEQSVYPESITLLETTFPNKGGPVVYDQNGNLVDGQLNAPLQELANRTRWLKDNIGNGSGGGGSSRVEVVDAGYFPSTFTITEDHIGKMINFNDSYGDTVIIPSNLGVSGDEVHFIITDGWEDEHGDFRNFYAGSSPISTATPYMNKLRTLYSVATAKKIGTKWVLFGDLATGGVLPSRICHTNRDWFNGEVGGKILLEGMWGADTAWEKYATIFFAYSDVDPTKNIGDWLSDPPDYLKEFIIYETDAGITFETSFYEDHPMLNTNDRFSIIVDVNDQNYWQTPDTAFTTSLQDSVLSTNTYSEGVDGSVEACILFLLSVD